MKFLYLMGRIDERSRYACHVHTFAIALMLSEESNPISEEQNIFVKTLYLALKNAFSTFVNLKELRLVSARREAVARPTLSELLEIVPFRLQRLQLLGFQFSEALPLINGHPSLKMLDFDDLGQTEAFTLSQLPPQLSPPIQLQVAELHFNSALGWLPTQASLNALHLKNFIVLDVHSPAEYKTWASLARAIESVRWLKISPYIQNCSLQILIPHLRSLECLQIFDLVRVSQPVLLPATSHLFMIWHRARTTTHYLTFLHAIWSTYRSLISHHLRSSYLQKATSSVHGLWRSSASSLRGHSTSFPDWKHMTSLWVLLLVVGFIGGGQGTVTRLFYQEARSLVSIFTISAASFYTSTFYSRFAILYLKIHPDILALLEYHH